MKSNPTEFHQLGYFICLFQSLERQIEELIVLLSNTKDEEMVSILMSEIDFSGKLKAVDVMFARFIELRKLESYIKKDFHNEIDKIRKLSERRNDLVHSKYGSLINVDGKTGFLRENSKLKSSKGIRQEMEEELMPESFTEDFELINTSVDALVKYRSKILDWIYSDV